MIAECICGARKEFGPGDSGPIWWLIEHRKTHLIAAAPELVAALEACVDPDDCSWDHNGNCQAHYDFDKPHECYNAVARALLARVRGEEKQG